MLEEYIPDDAPDYFHGNHYLGTSPNPREYIEKVINPAVVTGSFPFTCGSYYKPTDGLIDRPAVIAGKTIVDLIKWSELPDDHQYHRTPKHDSDDRPYIRLYGRIRGILAHSLILDDGIDFTEATKRAVDDVADVPSDVSHQDLYDVVADWEGAPRVQPADEEQTYDVPRPALDERIKTDGYAAVHNWEEVEHELQLQSLADEVVTLGETDDGHGYGCKIDRLGYVETTDSPVPPGLYVTDIKIAEKWHPAHLAQAEAYRRSLFPDLAAEPHGMVVRLGPERGDYTVLTSHDDEWDTDELWRFFEKKARWMYENEKSPYPPALESIDLR